MAQIGEVRMKMMDFLQRELKIEGDAIRVLKLTRSGEGWEGTVEITEKNEYLKKIGYPTIFDKNLYGLSLDHDLSVTRYERVEEV